MINFTDLSEVRKYLHQHPELSGEEFKTQEFIRAFFEEHCPSATFHPLRKTGEILHIKGTSDSPIVLLRCELDALPIQESNSFEYRSTSPGISHKCGHDGHMTILLAVGIAVEQTPPKGDVYLLFQPAEETGEGAIYVSKSVVFQELKKPDYVFALHNIPGALLHSIHIKNEEITPSVISATITFKGKTAHAAEPQNGRNPAFLISELEFYAKENSQTDPNLKDFQIITPIFIEVGTPDFGISAGSGRAGFTLRTRDNKQMEQLKIQFRALLEQLSNKYKIPYSIEWSHTFRAVQNDNRCTDLIRNAAQENHLELEEMGAPFPWGEDFGIFTEIIPGALFGLGAGMNSPALHNPDYDFPDDLIDTGKNIFLHILANTQE